MSSSSMQNSFTDMFIRRPVFSTVLSLVLLMVGLMSLTKLPLREFPRIEANVITIKTTYPGADASLMEGFITSPIENAIAGVDGIDFVASTNEQSTSTVNVTLKLGYDINNISQEISDKVSSIRYKLPQDAYDPIIVRADPNAQSILYLAFYNKGMARAKASDYLARVVVPNLEAIDGVSNAVNYGYTPYVMRIWLDPKRMASRNITAEEVSVALARNNIQAATGRVQTDTQEYDVLAVTDLSTPEAFDNLVIKSEQGQLVRISDIGRAELATAERRIQALFDGQDVFVIGIIPKSNANPLTVGKAVEQDLETLKENLPKGLTAEVVWDNTKFIASSLKEVQRTIIEAAIVVMCVVFLFLGSFRTLLIPTVTIPLSLIGVCTLLNVMGFSLNTLTLLAMVLAIGMVVDDAIVVSENIHRHLEMGKSRVEAAIAGAREIRFAVIAMTLTLAAVYAPIAFLGGLTGSLFREFATTLAGAVIISGFVALTLSPMMCSKFLPKQNKVGKLEHSIERVTTMLANIYERALTFILKLRWLVIGMLVLVVVAMVWLFGQLPDELAPKEDRGVVLAIADGPATANIEYTKRYTVQLGKMMNEVPENTGYGIINGIPNGVNSAIAFMKLRDWDKRKRSIDEIIQGLQMKLFQITGMTMFAINPYTLPGAGSGFQSVQVVLKTIDSYTKLNDIVNQVLLKANQSPVLINVQSSLQIDKAQIKITVDRNLAGDLGVPMQAIASAVNLAIGDPKISSFAMAGRSYDVQARVDERYRHEPDALKSLYVRTVSGEVVPLGSVITIEDKIVPRKLEHFAQMRSATLNANPAPGVTLGQALAALEDIVKSIAPDIVIDYSGESRVYVDASGEMVQTVIYALIFIFLVLSAQFESFRAPFIILISVPLATAGALLALKLTGGTMNIYTKIGLVTLIGLISKHGILMVEFADQLREQGKNKLEAILSSAKIRLRPILMTTAAMVLGAVPLVMASGAGSISRSQMGWVIIGGMTFGTLLTLFVVPMAYLMIARRDEQAMS